MVRRPSASGGTDRMAVRRPQVLALRLAESARGLRALALAELNGSGSLALATLYSRAREEVTLDLNALAEGQSLHRTNFSRFQAIAL